MRKISVFFLLMSVSLCLMSSEIMTLSEVKAGMEGIGKTIFKGEKVETFTFKVLGVMEKFFPNKGLIIVELESPVLKDQGILAGMSGSPVYIDGKLIGAVAYGLNNFPRKPIGGVTPIEDILDTVKYNNKGYTIDISDIKLDFSKENLESIVKFNQNELIKRASFSPIKEMSPIRFLSINRGIKPNLLSFLTPVSKVIQTVKGTSPKTKDIKISKEFLQVSPADAVAVPLVRGDFELSASGTVTHVEGDKIYLFGHPWFNLGSVSFPLHKAEVISILPSYQNSSKLALTKHMIGTVVQDRSSSLQGVLGKLPYMIPLNVTLRNRNRSFHLELVDHPLLTPILSFISLNNILSSEYQDIGYQSIEVSGTIYIEDEKNITINDRFNGIFSFDEFTGLINAINFFVMNNKEKKAKIQKIDLEIAGFERVRNSSVQNVILEKNNFSPGEIMNISIFLKNERGRIDAEKITLKAPNLKPGSEFYLMVADKEEMGKFDAKNVKTSYFPEKLSSLIRAINNLKKNNRLYFKIMTPTRGLFIKGYEYANLPLSLRNVFVHNAQSSFQSEMKYSTIAEYQMEIPSIVKGKKLFKLKIKER
jgi:hypothetical protein